MDSVTTLQCQNLTCLTPNPLANKFCEKCGTPLVKRYLWMPGDWVKTYYRIGDLVDDRYLVKQPNVVLDTQPAQAPRAPDEPPTEIAPYLKLFPQRLHVPQIYGYIPSPDERLPMDLWLLEYGTVPLDSEGELLYPGLLPLFTEEWPKASALGQLHWLWQIARIWQPLQKKTVVSSLLDPSLLRVNGRLVQLLELKLDEPPVPRLSDLGRLWSDWIPGAAEEVRDFLDSLCQKLQSGEIDRAETLIASLDRALAHYGRSRKRVYHLYTCTDTGPTRDHNEDACYPAPDRIVTVDPDGTPIAIVCDGIGGQDGGEIASGLAIETLEQSLISDNPLPIGDDPDTISRSIERAIRITNDTISQRNDSEHRRERQRMGTTVVMNLARAHEMYVAHVGDSRVYWITANSCHQVTVDDDLASREVKLGYLLYRDAVQYPNAGALVQALGMSGANNLHPTVQRFILDEDCVFLLCSDGLSDYDRVEQYWDSEILPLLTGEKTVVEVGTRLLELANRKNGHDNATIALVHCHLEPADEPIAPLSGSDIETIFPDRTIDASEDTLDTAGQEETGEEIPTIPLPVAPVPASVPAPVPAPAPARSRPFSMTALVGLLALGAIGILGALAWQYLAGSPRAVTDPSPVPTSPIDPPPRLPEPEKSDRRW
ncbi:protein phosphatase 2C domain-containing protein [Pannus brasiliensis]